MSDSSLRPSANLRLPWRARLARLTTGTPRPVWILLLALGALGARMMECRATVLTCQRAAEDGNDGITVTVCRDEYLRTSSPQAGAHLASALRRTGDTAQAATVARRLLATAAQADAFYVLGKIAVSEKRFHDAAASLQLALALHRQERRWREVGRDLMAAAEVATEREEFSRALELLDECVTLSARTDDPGAEGYCHVAAAHVLGQLGYGKGAEAELRRARALPATPAHKVWLHLEAGNLHREQADHAQALVAFERALGAAGQLSFTRGVVSAHLNLAEVQLQLRAWDVAQVHLDTAELLDTAASKRAEIWGLRAELALGRGELTAAAQLAERALAGARTASRDDQLELATLRASIALAAGELATAQTWAERALVHAEAVRVRQPLLQLRSWAVEQRRAPYDVLFLALARRGQAEDALRVFDRWRQHAFATAAQGDAPPPSDGLPQLARKAARLRQLRPQPAPAGEVGPRAPEAAPTTDAPLLALVVARDELWRITWDPGGTQLANLGRAASYRELIDELRTQPEAPLAAAALGAMLLPPELARATEQPLRVVLDAPLALMPVSYLRVGGRPLVTWRPVVVAQRPLDRRCVPRGQRAPGGALVLADVRGDLVAARREAQLVAQRVPARVVLGAAVGRATVLSAPRDQLLHLAVHAELDDQGGALLLQDGRLTALELAEVGHAPAQVVLATCGSAVARSGTHSLAMAYLAAGAEQVIATLRPISDEGAAALAERLYDAPAIDLVRGLAAAQHGALDHPGELSSFAAFGRPPCND